MAQHLVIVESPAKAKTIEKFLGRRYKVVASVGHVRDLPKSKMGVDIENDFDPKYINIRGKGDVIKLLKKEAKKADTVYLATDPDREGEAIAWHLAFILGIELDSLCRVTFHEITKDAVKRAVDAPRALDLNLVDAQQARRILDRLVGYSISPILWRKVKKGLSAGRVQSVATKLICDREREIQAFEPVEYWKIEALLTEDAVTETAFEFYGKDKKIPLQSKADVEAVLASIRGLSATVARVDEKIKSRKPSPPFITSSLQQEASNRLGFATKKTMMIAQQLYEGIAIKGHGTQGLITYMRTDSVRISQEARTSCRAFIQETYGSQFLGAEQKREKTSKNAQDAHEAIRPTVISFAPEAIEAQLSKDQFKLYKLIWDRFVSSEMADAQFKALDVLATIGDYVFKATGSTLVFEGFLKAYPYSTRTDKLLPEFSQGMALSVVALNPSQHFTIPPARYTEATLVKEMEDKGIGRPSTYAPTISTILGRGYVEREKKSLKPTELGFIIDEIMGTYFGNIVDIDFTADMERQFDGVENGERIWKEIIRDFYASFETLLTKADEEIEKVDLTEETDIECEKCGHKMLIRHGRYGKFLACSNYPECQNTKPILKTIGIHCPVCETGEIVERKTKKLKPFYGCSNFPDCRFVSWDRPIDRRCPKCGDILTIKRTRTQNMIKCHNPECDYREDIKEEKSGK